MYKAVYDFLKGLGFSWALLVFTSHGLKPVVQDQDTSFKYWILDCKVMFVISVVRYERWDDQACLTSYCTG